LIFEFGLREIQARETVKTVGVPRCDCPTSLKRGVNERGQNVNESRIVHDL
jgi:hypothetical protein